MDSRLEHVRYLSSHIAFAILVTCAASACGDEAAEPGASDAGVEASDASVARKPAFCQRSGEDAIRDIFCGTTDVSIRGIADVIALARLDPTPRGLSSGVPLAASAVYDRDYVATLGHSTALPGRVVSPINPRAIVFGAPLAMAYTRGVQRVEFAARARDKAGFNFYLLEFEQACNRTRQGCLPGDLYTPRIETDWLAVRVRDDEELKNTAFDCRQCHQRARETSTLLMRELEQPWNHFFFYVDDLPGINGSDLVQDYRAAKGDEAYGGISAMHLLQSTPVVLEGLVGPDQPLVFDAPKILQERWPQGPDGFADEPLESPTWEAAYAAFKRGEHLALPYLETRATDPDKQAALTLAYAKYRAGESSADELPDLGDIFPDDPRIRARIGLATEPDASAVDALIQACGSCHNDVLDQSITRARFNIDVSRLDRAALDLAIERIQLPRDAPGAMPPPEARQLAPEARARLIDYLRQESPLERNEALERAAKLGMAEPLPPPDVRTTAEPEAKRAPESN